MPALAGWLCAACALTPGPELPELSAEPVPELPGAYSESPAAGFHAPLEWWRSFDDPVLDEIVERVLHANLDMAGAIARARQARVRARLARAAILPTIGARGGAESFDVPVDAGIGAQLRELGLEDALGDGGFTLPERLGLTTYTLSADFAYELDFRDRAHHASLAAGAELVASEWDAQAARIGVVAETIAAYFDIVDLRRRIAVAGDTVDVLAEREQLAEVRYARGLTDSLDVYRVREDLRNTEAGLPQLEDRLAGAEARLAVLLGGYRDDVSGLLPETLSPSRVADPVPAGVPADLLRQRPDVRAAGYRLAAAGHDVEARRAELMPSLSFSGSIGMQTTEVAGIFNVQQWFGNLLGNLLAPVFDGGRLAGNVALAHARFNELAAAYGQTVVTAVNEVEAALTGLRNEGRRLAYLTAVLEEAQAEVDLQSERYAAGVGGYTDFLDASRTRLNVEAALAAAERDLALARLAVHRALGGAWTAPEPIAGEPCIVAASHRALGGAWTAPEPIAGEPRGVAASLAAEDQRSR